MELLSRTSTTPAHSRRPSSLFALGTAASPELERPFYPSPTQERAPSAVKDYSEQMAAASPANGLTTMGSGFGSGSVSPRTAAAPKTVTFELLVNEALQSRARLPLRVGIFPHDTTDSIVTTVKNFYGLYSGPAVSKGVSFEDDQGNTLIARYENFHDQMTVFVRVIEEVSPVPASFGHGFHSPSYGVQGYYNEGYPMQPSHHGHHISRPASRTSRVRSPSPNGGRGRRSTSAGTNPGASKKGRSRSAKNRAPGLQTNGDSRSDSVNGYSSGDGAPGSSSGKARDHLGNTEISVENIVEGGRRKRAKFESSVSASNEPFVLVRLWMLTRSISRNFLSLPRRRCRQLPRTRLCRRPVASSITATRCRLCTRGRTRSATPAPYSRRKAIHTPMPSPTCMPRPVLMLVATAEASDMLVATEWDPV